MPAPSCIPRFALPYTAADFAAALASIFRAEPPPPDQFDFLGAAPKFWTRSGRQALRILLGGLDLKPGSGVAVPLFTDPSVVAAIAAAGLKPIFIDVDANYLTIDPQSLEAARGKFSALVIVHLFGHMADVPALLDVAGHVPVIEDTAHAPLSRLNGRLAGEFGLASFYSFGSTKYWAAGGGGMAVVNDPDLAIRSLAQVQPLRPPSRVEEFRNLMMQAAKAAVFTRTFYPILGKPMRRWAERFTLLEPQMDAKGIMLSHAAVARRQAMRFEDRVARHRANSLRLLAQIGEVDGVVLPHERPGARYNYHLFPVLLRNRAERAEVVRAMWDRRIDTSMIYFDVAQQCRSFGYEGGCPVSESAADRLITLPNYASLSSADIDRVAAAFLSSLEECRAPAKRTEPSLAPSIGRSGRTL
ncbi:MAG: DegT/DnrJ/EryC1/StrS family aminotransferase [Acidobacteriia bacterium]|nr:DegT/DnrJ/EryC1/StrS family aminotransferase [Terriglobia bacterium]